MLKSEEQELLLKIVETWRLKEVPEYRGFRCANCQGYKNKAWYHWLNCGGYKIPVHMCVDKCEPEFRKGLIEVDETKRQIVDRNMFGNSYKFSDTAQKKFIQIVNLWPVDKEVELKNFVCDVCGQELETDTDGQRKGVHTWWKMPDNITLAELHFHKSCAVDLGI